MLSPASAIAWEFRRRHRWGLAALTGYLLVLAAVRQLLSALGRPLHVDSAEKLAFVILIPLTATFIYLLAVFSFGLSGDLAAPRSIYPARMFTLPVTTATLAGRPMLSGTASMAALWLVARTLAPWPSGQHVPWAWPGLLAAVLLAWAQALTWMPYALPGLRIVVTVLWLAVVDTVVLVALDFEVREPVMLALLAPQLPLAYLAARLAVARARRGDVPDGRRILALFGRIADALPRRRDGFASPARAQAWLEWRRTGWTLPALVAILLPFELGLLFVAAAARAPSLVLEVLIDVLFTPPFLAAFVGAAASRSDSRAPGLTPFLATRPLTSAALVAARLKAAFRSTLVAWLLILAAVPLALTLSGTWPAVTARAGRAAALVGTPRAIVLAVLVVAGLAAATWKLLVQGLYVGLTGREWVVRSSGLLVLSLLFFAGPTARWILDHDDAQAALWHALPAVLAILAGLKVTAGTWIAARLQARGLLGDRALVTGAATWLASVLLLYVLLAWLFSSPHLPQYVLLLVAVLGIPLARVSAAPLALAWNRHR